MSIGTRWGKRHNRSNSDLKQKITGRNIRPVFTVVVSYFAEAALLASHAAKA